MATHTRTHTQPAERCTCRTAPTLIGVFRTERLVALIRRHWKRDHCPVPPQDVDVDTWLAS